MQNVRQYKLDKLKLEQDTKSIGDFHREEIKLIDKKKKKATLSFL